MWSRRGAGEAEATTTHRTPSAALAGLRGRGHLAGTAVLVGLLGAMWHWLTSSGAVNRVILAPPAEVYESFVNMTGQSFFREHFLFTLQEVLVGFLAGTGFAVAMAGASTAFPVVKRTTYPLIVILNSVPKIVFLPLLIVWFGVGKTSTTILVALIAFFPTFVNTLAGLRIADRDGLQLLTSLGASEAQAFRMLRLPRALPLVFTGLKISANMAVVGAITGEFLGSPEGLGFLLNQYAFLFQTGEVYATVVAIALFAVVVYTVLEIVDRKLIFWR